MDAMEFLDKQHSQPQPLYVLHGEDDFLKGLVKRALTPIVIGESDPEFALATYLGESADFTSIRNELDTLPFLCERRLVMVEQADTFVTKFRPALEKYAAKPSTSGVLVLDVKTLAANTRLAKTLKTEANIVCKSPSVAQLTNWCVSWAKSEHKKKLEKPAAQLLTELADTHMGILANELAKLASYAANRESITVADVELLVSRSRGANVFQILDCVGNAQPHKALELLGRLYEQGEEPLMISGALTFQLRRCAQVAYHINHNVPLELAMDRAKVSPWPAARDATRKLLKHLGRGRLAQLFGWLTDLDHNLKGGSSLQPTLLIEQFLVKLAKPREVKASAN
jgi:DNA polymerase III subunit delta